MAAGVTRGAIYCHFKTKEHLAREIIKLFEEKFLRSMMAYVEEGDGNPSAKLERMLRFDIKFAGDYPQLCLFMTMISAEMFGSRNRFESYLKSVYRRWSEFITGILEEGTPFDDKIVGICIDAEQAEAGRALVEFMTYFLPVYTPPKG